MGDHGNTDGKRCHVPASSSSDENRPRILVLGVGNVLLSDEGLGVRAVERLPLAYSLPATVGIIDGGTSAMELIEDLDDLHALIVVDAIRAGEPPGSVIRIADDEVPVFFRTKLSPHQIGLCDVLATLEFLGKAPQRTTIIGIEPQTLALGIELSREVELAMPELLQTVVCELEQIGVSVLPFSPRAG